MTQEKRKNMHLSLPSALRHSAKCVPVRGTKKRFSSSRGFARIETSAFHADDAARVVAALLSRFLHLLYGLVLARARQRKKRRGEKKNRCPKEFAGLIGNFYRYQIDRSTLRSFFFLYFFFLSSESLFLSVRSRCRIVVD